LCKKVIGISEGSATRTLSRDGARRHNNRYTPQGLNQISKMEVVETKIVGIR